MADDNPRLRAALQYAERGWPVIPLHTPGGANGCSCGDLFCKCPGKHPRTPHGLKDATTDPGTIKAWWQRWPDANPAILTGQVSGIGVLDVDPRHGGDESLEELERKEGRLPETVESLTGGDGRHILYAYPEGGVRSRNGIAPGLDFKADGGYFVAPPSLHASGKTYEWEASSDPAEVPLAEMPLWLIARLGRPRGNGSSRESSGNAKIPRGRRNNELTSRAGVMRRKGMTEDAIRAALLADNQCLCDPPLDEVEVDRIAASVARYDPEREATDNGDVPQILVTNRQDQDLLRQAREALHSADPRLVYRDPGRLMKIDAAELRIVTGGELHDRLARAAAWKKRSRDTLQGAPVPRRLIEPLLEAPGRPIPIVRQVVQVPAFVGEDFELVTETGLRGDTLYLGDAIKIDPVPEEPSPQDHDHARLILESWFDEFTFADTTARAHAIALLITLLARPAIDSRTPMFTVEAATPGTGKTTLAEVICLAAHGKPPTSMTWTRDGEEMGKRCAALVIAGRPVGFFDDVQRITGDPAHILSSLITTRAVEVRAMRELATAGGRWNGVLIATGNNIRLAEEMPRKVCRIRLDSPEDPWTRRFRRPDLHAWTLEHRTEIIRAVAILVNAWKTVGRPLGRQTRPSFTNWAATIGGILTALDYSLSDAFLDPQDVADMMTFGEGIDELTAFVDAWAADPKLATASCKTRELAIAAERAGALENVMGNGNDRSRASRLGRYLKSQRGKVVHGHRIEGAHDLAANAICWKLITTSEQSEVTA